MNRQEAEELLPWFVTGALSEEEARTVQAFIDSGEISQTELAELSLFAETVAERAPEEPAYNPAILEKAMSQLDGITQEAPEPPLVVGEVGSDGGAKGRVDGGESTPGILKRLFDALQWSAAPPLARALLVGQFALLLGLVVVVATRTGVVEDAGFETVAGEPPALLADFTISFAPGITEADARALLLENRVSIVAGPSALGLYQIAAAGDADLNAVAEALRASPLIAYLEKVPQP